MAELTCVSQLSTTDTKQFSAGHLLSVFSLRSFRVSPCLLGEGDLKDSPELGCLAWEAHDFPPSLNLQENFPCCCFSR